MTDSLINQNINYANIINVNIAIYVSTYPNVIITCVCLHV